MSEKRETKCLELETKELREEGQFGHFVGFAAVYENVDLGGDVIKRGAFSKTLSERKDKLSAPVFYDHKIPIGSAKLEDSEFGLKAFGKLNLEKESSRDAYSDLKFYKAEGIHMGMSIQYSSIEKPTYRDDGVRVLKELKLYEVTVTLLPMNESATVIDVKSYPGRLDQYLTQWEEIQAELKSGRKISKERADRLRTAANEILSLLSEAGAEEATTAGEADGKSRGPVIDHAMLSKNLIDLKGALQWSRQ